MLMDACRLAAAIVVGIVVLAASGTAVAVDPDIALGRWPIAGEPVVCVASGRSTPGDPFSTLAQASGDFLLVRWGGAGWGLLWLSGDGRTVRRLEADVPTGRVTGAVRLGNGRVLVTAEQGLFAVDGDRRLQRIAGCEQIGMALFIVRRDGGASPFRTGARCLLASGGCCACRRRAGSKDSANCPPTQAISKSSAAMPCSCRGSSDTS
ncbi:MAG: hypothetical protein IPG91_16860 [Ideonella sp.]|nr:hypothetical protein [Ideonella sp.]